MEEKYEKLRDGIYALRTRIIYNFTLLIKNDF